MLRLPEAMKVNTVSDVVYRTAYITGRITAVRNNNRYDVEIGGCGKSLKNVFVNDTNIVYVVGNTVGIGWDDGNRGRPLIFGILRDIIEIEVTSGVNALGV